MNKNKDSIDEAAKSRSESTSKVDLETANLAKNKSDLKKQQEILQKKEKSLADGNAIRTETQANNEATIAEAEKQADLLGQAVEILSATASGQAVAFVQQQQRPDVVEARAGSSGLQTAITSVENLQTAQLNLAADTKAAESTAANEWENSAKDLAEGIKDAKGVIGSLKNAIAKGEEDIYNANETLTIAKEEWQAAVDDKNNRIDPMCVQTAVSHEERAQKRNEEIQSLQEALEILSSV